jgi:hypothetical protein
MVVQEVSIVLAEGAGLTIAILEAVKRNWLIRRALTLLNFYLH